MGLVFPGPAADCSISTRARKSVSEGKFRRSFTYRLVALMDCETGDSKVAWASRPHVYPHLVILLPSPCNRGEGPGVRGLHRVLIWILIVNLMSSCVSEA